ncbi:MAG: tetratricopeptide repeat protein [Desulfuromonadaceae bacterium]
MYNLLISAAASISVLLIMIFVLKLAWWGSLIVAIIVLVLVFVLFSKITMKKVMASFETSDKDLQAQPPRFEKAIRELKDALQYSKWQLFVEGQIESRIGMIYYANRDFSKAFPHLEKSFFKNGAATAMLAVSYMKRQKKDKMISTFEKAVQWNGKESMLWALYAYCMNESGEADKAREILTKGLKKNPGDEKLQDLLQALQNGKKMNMRAYGDLWFQFHLESLGALQKYQMASMGGRMQRRMGGRR